MKAYMLYNHPKCQRTGDGTYSPQMPHAKLAAICQDTWEEHGWEIERFTSYNGFPSPEFTGRLKGNTYPQQQWNRWSVQAQMPAGWFIDFDTINRGFTPVQAGALRYDHPTAEAIILQAPCNLGVFYATPEFSREVCRTITDVDSGKIEHTTYGGLIDESIIGLYLRHLVYFEDIALIPRLNTGWQKAKIWHYAGVGIELAS